MRCSTLPAVAVCCAPGLGLPSGVLPIIGITTDLSEVLPEGSPPGATPRRRAVQAMTYVEAVRSAGGLPVLLPPLPEQAGAQCRAVDALLFTGGQDVDMRRFGLENHPATRLMHPQRQEHELALLQAADALPRLPVLGICLGMQLMCLHRGGTLIQHLADTLPTAERHLHDTLHPILPEPDAQLEHGALPPGAAASSHHQAVAGPGTLRTVARSDDGVIEAVDDPSRPFYFGVQWHPERTPDPGLGAAIVGRLVRAAERYARQRR
jgi:putative glutamine amidotransferase